jgi:phosphoglycolate phosphatase
MQTGNAAGITTVGVTWGFRTEEVLREHGAVYIVDTAEEIISIVKGEK